MQNYEQVKVLGEGGFGKAILARQKSDGRMCVIKEVRLSSLSTKDRNEALKEAKVLASLKHPNIVQYITSFQERGCFYIVMEFADGGDLSQKIEKRKNKLFSEEEVLHDFIQISLAIKYIHDRKILHRDLKTQNIFLTKDGEVKLGDFGIASVLEHTFQLCRTQIGTPYYLSPEICEGKSYNAKTDIWSLGCILYELCTLQHAFQGCNMKGLMMNICRGKVAPINKMYSNDLKSLLRSMLTTDPKKRPSINQILALPFIKSRLNSLLDKTILDYEFSHTVLHGRKPLAAPTVVLSHNKEPHNLLDDYEDDQKDNRNYIQKVPSENKAARPTSAQRQKESIPSRENRSPSRQKQIQQMQQQRANLPTGADPRYYQRQQRVAANANIPENADPRYARRQQQQQAKIEEEARKKEANERERQRLRLAEEQRRQKQKLKEKEEEERRIHKQEEIERERRRQEEQKRQDEEKKRRLQQQQALQERRKRIQEDMERKKEEERMRKRIEADEARRRSEEEERERQREQIKMKQDMREQQRKRREEEEADIKRRDEERKRQRLIEQQREKEELEAEKAQLMEEEKQKKLAAMKRQRELREEQKRQLEEDKKRKQQQEDEIMKDNGYLEFQGEKEQQNQQRRRQINRKITPSFSENEIPARQRQRPKWVDPEGRSYNDDEDDEPQYIEPIPKKQRKPTWASSKNDDDDEGQYNKQPQPPPQQKRQKPAWVSPTDPDYDNQPPPQQQQLPPPQRQPQQVPPRKKKPAWVSPNGEPYNEPLPDDDIEMNDQPAWAKNPPKKAPQQKRSSPPVQQQQQPPPKQNVLNKKFDDMTQEERNEYMRQLRHEAKANRQKANKIELEEGDDENVQNPSNERRSSPPVQQQQQLQPPRKNIVNKKFDDMTQEERNEYMRQLRHEAQANRQKANKIQLEEGDDQEIQNPANERRSSPPVQQQQQLQPPRKNIMNKKFDDMTQEERNEYMRQLRHEAQANRQKANKIQLEEGDDQEMQNPANERRSSPPQQQPPRKNIMNKKFDDMSQEERNEYMRQLRHEAQANRQKANKIQLEEGDDQEIQNPANERRSSPPQQLQPPRKNIMNKKFDDMTQEERNEYMRQLRHEAQANRQKANKIQLEEGDDQEIQNPANERRSSPPQQQVEQPPKQNIMNKKFDDMTQEERNEYMRQLRHEAQANRQKANKIQLEEGDDQEIQNPANERRSSPPVQQRPPPQQPPQQPMQNLLNKKFDDMTQEERNEYMRQLRHEAQANRQKANKIQLEEGDDQEIQNPANERRSSPPVQQRPPPQQPPQQPRQNVMNKKFDDMTQEERNEYMRQLRHEAQANRQKANRIQLEEGDDQEMQNPENDRRSPSPIQQRLLQQKQVEQPPKQNVMNKKFDDMTQEERNEYMRQLRHEAQANRQKANRIQLEEGDDQNQYNNENEQRPPKQQPPQQPRQNIMNKKFDDMTQEERNEYMRQLRHEAQANRQKANRIQLEEGDDLAPPPVNNNNNARPPVKQNKNFDEMSIEERNEYARQLRHEAAENRKRAMQNYADDGNQPNRGGANNGEYANIKDERIAKHEISEEDRRRIYEEQRAAFKAYRSRGRLIDNGAEAREALEDPSLINRPPPKDDRIAKHEISEEDRRRIYEEQRAAFKAYRNRGRLLDKGAEVREAIEDPDYVNQPLPKDERIAKHEISEEDRRRIYEEQRAAFKAYRSRGRDIDNGAEVRDAIEDPDYVNQPPPKDDRIAKHEISEEDRRRIYEEQRAAFKAYRSRGRDIDNGAEVRDAIEDPDYVNQPPPKDDRIAKHEISEEDRRRIYEEQRAAFKAYKNRGRVVAVDSFVEEPPFTPSSVNQEKKNEKKGNSGNNNNGRLSNDLYYIDDDVNDGYNFNSNLYYNKNKNAKPSAVAKAAMFSPDFDDEEYDNTPQWAKNPPRRNPPQQKQQQMPAPNSPRFYDAINDDDDDDAFDDSVKVFSPQINNQKKAPSLMQQNGGAVVGNKRMIQLDNIIENSNNNDNYDDDDDNYGFGNFNGNDEEISKAEKDVEKLQRYAFSLKEALNLPEQNGNNFENDDDDGFDNGNNGFSDSKNQIFYIQDKQLSLPVASDEESKSKRITEMRNYLEKQIGMQKLNDLNNELINKAQNDSIPTPVINDLPPGLVCLAEQLLVLDGQNQK